MVKAKINSNGWFPENTRQAGLTRTDTDDVLHFCRAPCVFVSVGVCLCDLLRLLSDFLPHDIKVLRKTALLFKGRGLLFQLFFQQKDRQIQQ